MGFSWTDDDGGPGDHAGDGHIEPYAGSGASGEQTGSQMLSTEGHPMPDDDLDGRATADGSNEDHGLTYPGRQGNSEGPNGLRGIAHDHERASSSGVTSVAGRVTASRDRGPEAPPQDEHTVPGVDGARPGYDGPEPVWRRKGSTTQRP